MALKSVKTALAFWMCGTREKERGWPETAALRNTSPSSEEREREGGGGGGGMWMAVTQVHVYIETQETPNQ